jgi:hypothetical protein
LIRTGFWWVDIDNAHRSDSCASRGPCRRGSIFP